MPSSPPLLSRHNGTTIRGHEGTTHMASHSRPCSLCAVLGSGRHNPTLMRRHQRVTGEAWRVPATSALPHSLRCAWFSAARDVVFGAEFVNHRRLPQRCRRSLHRHRHPRRTAAAVATAATVAAAATAAVRRLLCCGCGWCLLRLFLKNIIKTGCFVVVVIVVIEPGRPRRCCCRAAVCLMVLCWPCPCR